MPGLNGFETARQIRVYDDTFDIPILFIPAMNSAQDKLRALEAGGVDFISTPFNQQELLARVTAIWRGFPAKISRSMPASSPWPMFTMP